MLVNGEWLWDHEMVTYHRDCSYPCDCFVKQKSRGYLEYISRKFSTLHLVVIFLTLSPNRSIKSSSFRTFSNFSNQFSVIEVGFYLPGLYLLEGSGFIPMGQVDLLSHKLWNHYALWDNTHGQRKKFKKCTIIYFKLLVTNLCRTASQ